MASLGGQSFVLVWKYEYRSLQAVRTARGEYRSLQAARTARGEYDRFRPHVQQRNLYLSPVYTRSEENNSVLLNYSCPLVWTLDHWDTEEHGVCSSTARVHLSEPLNTETLRNTVCALRLPVSTQLNTWTLMNYTQRLRRIKNSYCRIAEL